MEKYDKIYYTSYVSIVNMAQGVTGENNYFKDIQGSFLQGPNTSCQVLQRSYIGQDLQGS